MDIFARVEFIFSLGLDFFYHLWFWVGLCFISISLRLSIYVAWIDIIELYHGVYFVSSVMWPWLGCFKHMSRSCFGLELLVLFSWRMRGISLFLLPFLIGLMQYDFGDYDRSPYVAGCASQFCILCFFLNLEWLYLFFFVCNYGSVSIQLIWWLVLYLCVKIVVFNIDTILVFDILFFNFWLVWVVGVWQGQTFPMIHFIIQVEYIKFPFLF